jgi:hypothetical protein
MDSLFSEYDPEAPSSQDMQRAFKRCAVTASTPVVSWRTFHRVCHRRQTTMKRFNQRQERERRTERAEMVARMPFA